MNVENLYFLIKKGKLTEVNLKLRDLNNEIHKLLVKGSMQLRLGNLFEANNLLRKAVDNLDDTSLCIWGLNDLAWINFRLGNFKDSNKYISKIQSIFNEMKSIETDYMIYQKSNLYNTIGSLKFNNGQLERAKIWFQKTLELRQRLNDPILLASAQNNLGFMYQKLGKFDQAMTLYKKAISVYESQNLLEEVCSVRSNIAEIYRLKSDFTSSLEIHEQVLETRKETNNSDDLALTYMYIGLTNYDMGKYTTAETNFAKSLSIWREINNDYWKSKLLFLYGRCKLKCRENIENILSELKTIKNSNSNNFINASYYLLKALKLKSISRMHALAKSQAYLQNVLDLGIDDFDILFDTYLHSADILLKELSIANNDSIYSEAKDKINQIEELTKNNFAYGKTIDILFLKAKMALVELDYNHAKAMIVQAELLAIENDMEHYLESIEIVKNTLNADMNKLEEIIQKNKSILERTKMLEINQYLSEVTDLRKKLDQTRL